MLTPTICIKTALDTYSTQEPKSSLGAYNPQYYKRASSSQSGKRHSSFLQRPDSALLQTSSSFRKQNFQGTSEFNNTHSTMQFLGPDLTPNTTMYSTESLTNLDADCLTLTATKSGEVHKRRYLQPSFSRKESSMEKTSTVKLLDVSGVLQKSEDIVNSLRTPKQIYTETFEIRSPTIEDSNAQNRRKSKIRRHLAIQDKNMRSPGSKIEIPIEYYKKLNEPKKEDKKEKTEKKESLSVEPTRAKRASHRRIFIENEEVKTSSNKERKVKPIAAFSSIFKQNETAKTLTKKNSIPITESPNKIRRPIKLKKRESSFYCVTNDSSDEQTLSFEGNNNNLQNTLYAQPNVHKQHDFQLERRSVTPFRNKRNSHQWILRTTQIKDDIDSFMSKTEDYLDFAETCQEKNADNIRNLGNTNYEEFMREKDERISYDENEVKEVLKELKEVDQTGNLMKMGFANKRNLSSAKAAYAENVQLYRNMLTKQHRAVDKTMGRIYTPKLKYLAWIGEGRKIFV